jgi:hypothetical protein
LQTTEEKVMALLEQEEKLLYSALVRTMKAYNESPTIANLKDYQAAKRAYDEFCRRKEAQLNPESRTFKTQAEILEYLKEQGWKISKASLSEKFFAIKKQKDGTVLKEDVDAFAEKFLRKLDGSDNGEIDISAKLEAEIRKINAEAEKKEIEVRRLKGELVERYEVEQQLADRAVYLRNSLEEFFRSMTPHLIEKAGGDLSKTADIMEFCLEELDNIFNHYAKPLTFSVPTFNNNGGDDEGSN